MVSKDITLKYFTNLHVQQNSDNWSNKLTFLDNYNLERIHNWYSHQQDITSKVTSQPIPKSGKPTYQPLNRKYYTALGWHTLAYRWPNNSNTKCCDLSHISPAFYHQAKSSDVRFKGLTLQHYKSTIRTQNVLARVWWSFFDHLLSN